MFENLRPLAIRDSPGAVTTNLRRRYVPREMPRDFRIYMWPIPVDPSKEPLANGRTPNTIMQLRTQSWVSFFREFQPRAHGTPRNPSTTSTRPLRPGRTMLRSLRESNGI